MIRLLWAFLIGILCVLPDLSAAHTRSQSFSSWELNGRNATFDFAVDSRRVTQLAGLDPDSDGLKTLLETHLRTYIKVTQDGENCALTRLAIADVVRETMRAGGAFTCPKRLRNAPARVQIHTFFPVSPTHIHMARIVHTDFISDVILSDNNRSLKLEPRKAVTTITDFITAGFIHVISGLDHIVFIIALAFVARTTRQALWAVSGFTVGHMLSLAAVSLGLLSPNTPLIEALIGFTIAAMALEAATIHTPLQRRTAFYGLAVIAFIGGFISLGLHWGAYHYFIPAVALAVFAVCTGRLDGEAALRILPAMTLIFGLVHGAGFAGGFLEYSASSQSLWGPLIGFNIGVELAQLWILIVAYILFSTDNQKFHLLRVYTRYGFILAIFMMGCFWFGGRFTAPF